MTRSERLFGRHIRKCDMTKEQLYLYKKEWRLNMSEEKRAQDKIRQKAYNASKAGREAYKRYYYSEKGQAADKRAARRYWATDKCKQGWKKKNQLRAKQLKLAGTHPSVKLAHYDSPCIICGVQATTLDHIVPISKGGSHRLRNIWPLCRPCNSRKSNKSIEEVML